MKKKLFGFLAMAVFVSSASADAIYREVVKLSSICYPLIGKPEVFDKKCGKEIKKIFGGYGSIYDSHPLKPIMYVCYKSFISEKFFGYDSPVTQENLLNCVMAIDEFRFERN